MALSRLSISIPIIPLLPPPSISPGGRVTDTWDQHCLSTILSSFYCQEMLEEGYAYSSVGAYRVVTPDMSWQQTLDTIHRLPADDPADVFGMDKNAEMVSWYLLIFVMFPFRKCK